MAVAEADVLGGTLLSGYGQDETGPSLWLDRLGSTPWCRQRFAVRGRAFTLEAREPRYCTGRHDLDTGRSLPCPARSELVAAGVEQCLDCLEATGFNPAFYNAARISDAQQRRNREPHSVYLASFGPGTHKVGMTYARRGLGRLLEQGARRGVVLATFPDADRARELEAFVARELGFSEGVRGGRKRQLLGSPLSFAEVQSELAEWVARIAGLRAEVDADAEVINLDAHYGPPDLFAEPITDLSETEPLAISGEGLALVGDVLIMREGRVRYMLSLAPLVAREIAVGEGQRPNRFVGQLALPF